MVEKWTFLDNWPLDKVAMGRSELNCAIYLEELDISQCIGCQTFRISD